MGFVLLYPATSFGDTLRFKAAGGNENPHWEPTARRIQKGDRIVWKNPTGITHTVTAYGGNWSKNTTLEAGERTSKIFKRAGTFRFRCLTLGHSSLQDGACQGMCGKVVVRSY